MSKKSPAIAERIRAFESGDLNPYYAGYFDCFNQQQFYEAHDVLEELWLKDRHGPAGDFYKGLIQLAGAFVHLQKRRTQPSIALLNLAEANLSKYAPRFERLDVTSTLELIMNWRTRIRANVSIELLLASPPRLQPD
jgi:predicted metal-dependent hydrolase